MASVLDSEAHFTARCAQIRIGASCQRELLRLGFRSEGQFAYATGQPGQPETDWSQWVTTNFGSISAGDTASLRRLLFECQTMLLADLKEQVSNPQASAARPLADAERERRLADLRTRVPGVLVEGEGEPSRALLELACAMVSLNKLRYIAPSKCTSRLSEIALAKPTQKVVELDQKALVLRDRQAESEALVNTPLQFLAAMKRRGLALSFADACDFVQHERYVSMLMSHLNRDPAFGPGPCMLHQVIEADRLVHVRMLELGVSPKRDASGQRPLDKAMIAALESYHVSFSLIPAAPGRGRSNKRKGNMSARVDDDGSDKQRSNKRPSKGAGKSKSGKGKEVTRDPPLPAKLRELKGKGTLPDGRAICFNYNLAKCSQTNCPRAHVCARCFQAHCILQCPQVKFNE